MNLKHQVRDKVAEHPNQQLHNSRCPVANEIDDDETESDSGQEHKTFTLPKNISSSPLIHQIANQAM